MGNPQGIDVQKSVVHISGMVACYMSLHWIFPLACWLRGEHVALALVGHGSGSPGGKRKASLLLQRFPRTPHFRPCSALLSLRDIATLLMCLLLPHHSPLGAGLARGGGGGGTTPP